MLVWFLTCPSKPMEAAWRDQLWFPSYSGLRVNWNLPLLQWGRTKPALFERRYYLISWACSLQTQLRKRLAERSSLALLAYPKGVFRDAQALVLVSTGRPKVSIAVPWCGHLGRRTLYPVASSSVGSYSTSTWLMRCAAMSPCQDWGSESLGTAGERAATSL